MWAALALLAISLVAAPAVAQDDCDSYPDWDDIGWVRSCIGEHGRGEDWATEKLLDGAARFTDDPAIIHVLLQAGTDPRAERNDGRTLLHSALRNDAVADHDVISALIPAGGADNLTPLQVAAVQGDAVTVTSLLAEGADPNTGDTYGWNALHFAVPVDKPEVVSILREAGADPSLTDGQEWSPLHFAVRMKRDDPSVVLALLQVRAEPSPASADDQAWTPHHLAARMSDPSVVLALVYSAADPTAADEDGRRPVDFALANHATTERSGYPPRLVPGTAAWVAGRTVTGDLRVDDGVGWGSRLLRHHYDGWTYSAAVGQRAVITMDSDDVDAYLVVVRDDGTEVASDDGGDGLNAPGEFRGAGRPTNTRSSRRTLSPRRQVGARSEWRGDQ